MIRFEKLVQVYVDTRHTHLYDLVDDYCKSVERDNPFARVGAHPYVRANYCLKVLSDSRKDNCASRFTELQAVAVWGALDRAFRLDWAMYVRRHLRDNKGLGFTEFGIERNGANAWVNASLKKGRKCQWSFGMEFG